nr:hypothetical protein [Pedobacter panaciterrae]
MKFKMDSQSYGDLNIFPSHHTSFSVFALFKKTKTLGGRDRLEEMMRNPGNDVDYLTQRRDSIEFFKISNLEVKVHHDQFDLILHYLNYDKGYLRNNLIDSTLAFISNKINSNQDYYIVQIGLDQLLSLLRHSVELVSVLTDTKSPEFLKRIGRKMSAILDNEDIKYAIPLTAKKNLRYYELSKLDALIRRKNTFRIIELLRIFYELDVFETLAKISKDKNFCLPTYTHDKNVNIAIKGLFHPGINEPVCNDIVIDNKNNLIFLTGSNMAGKSSFLKSIGIAVYLSHIGFPVPARELHTVVFNGLITTINLADNIQNGLSHYFSEVLRVKQIASTLIETTRLFIILDELFKGTNSKDAHDGSLMVLNGLSEIQNSIFIISSHITELTKQLKKENIELRYLENLIVDKIPKFTYLLKEGVSEDGIGMYFLHKENISELLTQARTNDLT